MHNYLPAHHISGEDVAGKQWKYLRNKEEESGQGKMSGSEGGGQRKWKFLNTFVKKRTTSLKSDQTPNQPDSELTEVYFNSGKLAC